MARPSLPRPPALHHLHLGRTGPIGPERRQYDLLNPRRGIMMRLMQSMVPTQEHCGPVSVVHVELGADHQDRWRRGVETCLSAITPLEE